MKRSYLFVVIILLSLMVGSCSATPSESSSPSSTGSVLPTPETTPPPGQPKPVTQVVFVESKPSGARVWLNGEDTGQEAPFTFMAEPGEHTVVFKLEGYYDKEIKVPVKLGDSAIHEIVTMVKVEETPEAYKARAQEIEYRVLEKSPDKYKGVVMTYTGHVAQIIEDAGVTFMRVEVTQSEYGNWSDVVGVIYMGTLDVFDDDIVSFWGPGSGTYEYESQAGWKISIPSVLAKYVEK
jgi:hypothetical protein